MKKKAKKKKFTRRMRKISKLRGETVRPVEANSSQSTIAATPDQNPSESQKLEKKETQTTGKKIKRKERVPRSDMAKHLDLVLIVSVASLVILAIVYHFEQKNQILEKAKGFIEAKMPFLFG